MSRNKVILFAAMGLLLLAGITVALRHEPIESDLAERARQALAAYAITGVEVRATGRDLRLSGEIPRKLNAAYVAGIVEQVWGVREVDVSGLQPQRSLLDPDDPLNPRFDPRRIARLGGDVSNPLDADTCQRMMTRLASVSSIRFAQGGASPMLESYPLLNDLAAIAYQCPATRLVIGGHTDAGSDGDFGLRLSQARAEAVERFFYQAGIPAWRMQVIAYGDSQPIASNASPQGRAANRRITFDVLPLE